LFNKGASCIVFFPFSSKGNENDFFTLHYPTSILHQDT
jgi:hypothetical protein